MSNIEIMEPASESDLTGSSSNNSSNGSSNSCIAGKGAATGGAQQITIDDPNVPKPALSGAIQKGNLYLNLLNIPPGDYSKELFITLLDKAEEAGCKNVIVCLNKQASVRPFAFLGFKLLPPNHPLVPGRNCSENVLFMGYQLEGDDI